MSAESTSINLQPLSLDLYALMRWKKWNAARACASDLAREANRAYLIATFEDNVMEAAAMKPANHAQ